MKIDHCPFCGGSMKIQKLKCLHCDISIEGEFFTSPILSLCEDDQLFIELFVLNSGSLKDMAEIMQVTYPTIRNRLNGIIARIREIAGDRESYKAHLLKKVQEGELDPGKAANIIRNL